MFLCDADHGLAHDLDLVMTRRDGELIVLDAGGRRVWGRADAAFSAGLPGIDEPRAGAGGEPFTGVQPIDDVAGRRPTDRDGSVRRSCGVPVPSRARRRGPLSTVVFPQGEPPGLPDTVESGGEPMSLAWAVGVLMLNRDLDRRLAAELGAAA